MRNRQKLLRDYKQHTEYRTVLGNDVPKEFDKFRDLKYNKGEKFEQLRQQVLNKKKTNEFLEKLHRGEINTKIKNVKQQEHIRGTKKWKQRVESDLRTKGTAPDMFYKDTDIQMLFDSKVGTGDFEFRKNQQYPIEYINADKPIGRYFNMGTGKYEETRRFAIRYSSKGWHAHPVKEV